MKIASFLVYLFCISCAFFKPSVNKKESFRYELPIKEDTIEKPTFPLITTKKLPNGLTVYVLSKKDLPIVSINVVFKAGMAVSLDNKPGVINLLALMLKEGSKNKSSLQMANAFADLGSKLEVDVTFDKLTLSIDCTHDKLEQASKLLFETLEYPRFLKEDFVRIQQNLIAELESIMSIPSYKAQKEFFNAAYTKNHPYAKSIIDNPKDLNNVSLDDVKKAYEDYFGPQNAALIIVGNTDYKDVKRKSLSFLNFNKKIAKKSLPISYNPPKEMQIVLVPQAKTPQTYLMLGQVVADASNIKEMAALEIIKKIMASSPTSRLLANLRESKGWTYGVQSSLIPLVNKSSFTFSSSIQVPYGVDALEEILAECDKIQKNLVSQEELTFAKNNVLMSFNDWYSTLESSAEIISLAFIHDMPSGYESKAYDITNEITAQDIQQVAKKYLSLQRMVVIAVGDTEIMSIPLKKKNMSYRIKQ